MNSARMGTGLQALAYASAAYLLAVNYARERVQGRDLKDIFDPSAPSVAIIKHPDVRRNLLWMKSYVDGMRSFFYYMATCYTRAMHSKCENERTLNNDLFELMTPLIKDYLSVHGHEVCVQALQVHGGVGYCSDYLVEQYTRDCKITSIFEGTSGIQAMDLLGRKLGMKKGQVFISLLGEIHKIIAKSKKVEPLSNLAVSLEAAVNQLGEIAMYIGQKAQSADFKVAFAHSLPFLEVMGDTIIAWMVLWRALVASQQLEKKTKKKDKIFYEGQIKTADFFINTQLPVTKGKIEAIQKSCAAALEIHDDAFGGL